MQYKATQSIDQIPTTAFLPTMILNSLAVTPLLEPGLGIITQAWILYKGNILFGITEDATTDAPGVGRLTQVPGNMFLAVQISQNKNSAFWEFPSWMRLPRPWPLMGSSSRDRH
jgi:hypothetical protein